MFCSNKRVVDQNKNLQLHNTPDLRVVGPIRLKRQTRGVDLALMHGSSSHTGVDMH